MNTTYFKTACGILIISLLMCSPVRPIATNDSGDNNPLATALFLATSLEKGSTHKDEALSQIARAYMFLKRPEESFRAMREMNASELLFLSAFLANEAIKTGNLKYSIRIINEAFIRTKDEDIGQKNNVFAIFVDLLIQIGEFDFGIRIADSIEPDSSYKALAAERLARGYIGLGQEDRALLFLNNAIKYAKQADVDANEVCPILLKIIVDYGLLGKPDLARSVLKMAGDLAEKNTQNKGYVDGVVSVAYAEAGNEDEGLLRARRLPYADRIETQFSIASIFSNKGEDKKAHDLISETATEIKESGDYENNQGRDLTKIVRFYLQADLPDEALKTIKLIENEFACKEAAVAIFDWSRRHAQVNIGIQALDVASIKARLIISEKREEITGAMSTSRALEKAYYLSEIADKYIEAKQFDKARTAIDSIDLPQRKAEKLAVLAAAMSPSSNPKQIDQLLSLALRISEKSEEYNHDGGKDLTLARIAEAYGETGNKKHALKVFAQVLTLDSGLEDYDDRLYRLAIIGFDFEKAQVKADDQVRILLRKIMQDWSDD